MDALVEFGYSAVDAARALKRHHDDPDAALLDLMESHEPSHEPSWSFLPVEITEIIGKWCG